ncbi:dynein regulatory complex subunit 3-like [Neocloeon triangulifer]|uniref:dynein regulatory complex subunit 3-like n=1 Tax=Neocloeon triangulifer TaxID=2078957 RepID=UPI00286F4BEF|nr:dynein regulatory complex subunit 3-like [Neocloeon triangulifer]
MSTVQIINEQVPRVIDQQLIERQANESNLLVTNLRSLDLHSSRIFVIENLWHLESLTVLKLNDNCIERMENLDALTNLIELNLSFNRISKIENLKQLVNLERLLLHSNQIHLAENMDTLQNLRLLTLSQNQIDSFDSVIYLRRLKNLRALSMDNNPVCKEAHFQEFVLEFLPELRYYEYNLISNDQRPKESKFKQLLAKVEEEEAEADVRLRMEQQQKRRRLELEKAFVETVEPSTLLQPLASASWSLVVQIGALEDLQAEHKVQVAKVCEQLQEAALAQMQRRQNEIDLFHSGIRQARLENGLQGQKLVEDFMAPKEKICEDLRKLLAAAERRKPGQEESPEMDQVREIANQLINNSESLKDNLMVLEIELQEQIEEKIEIFSRSMSELMASFQNVAKLKLLRLRELEMLFHRDLLDPCLTRASNIYLKGQGKGAQLLELAKEPSLLMEQLIENHEERLHEIWRQEVKLVASCDVWLENQIAQLKENEFKRGREQVLEVAHFVDLQQQEMMDLQPGSCLPSLGLL